MTSRRQASNALPSGKIHTCTVCKKQGVWDSWWSWYGSYKQLEDGDFIVKACSDDCMRQAQAAGLVPIDGDYLDD